MKKRNIIISIFLVSIMLATMLVPAFAAIGDGSKCKCGHSPVIQIRGIGETLYVDNEEVFSTENIVAGILPVVPQLAQFLLDTSNIDLFVDAASQAVKNIFGPVMYDANGNRSNTVTVNRSSDPITTNTDLGFTPSSEQTLAYMLSQELDEGIDTSVSQGHSYLFTYDWTADPFVVAQELDQFIEEVKTKSGHTKVSICAESMGGAVLNAYLSTLNPLFNMGKFMAIDTIVMSNSAFNGLEMMGQLFTGNTDIDGDKLAELISQEIVGNAEYESLLTFIPIFQELAKMANQIMAAGQTRIYNEILIPVFGYIPSFWSLIPADKYDSAESYMLSNSTNAKIKDFVADYKSVVKGTSARMSLVQGYGAKFYNVANYNRYIAPVTPSADWNSDGVIETVNASGFAKVAKMDETLDVTYGGEYTSLKTQYDADKATFLANNPKISPDFVVDASKCNEPDNTWFIKNLGHISYDMNDGTGDFYVWLLTGTSKYTVDSNPEYPQFMYYDTTARQLMTWEDKEEKDEASNGGITLPEIPELPEIPGVDELPEIPGGTEIPDLPGFDVDNVTGAITEGLESLLGGSGGGEGGVDLGGVVDILTGVGGMLGGLLGGLGGGGSETPSTPSTDTETDDTEPEEPTTQAPSKPATNNNTQQTTGTPVEVEGGNYGLWLAVVITTLTILGILVVAL